MQSKGKGSVATLFSILFVLQQTDSISHNFSSDAEDLFGDSRLTVEFIEIATLLDKSAQALLPFLYRINPGSWLRKRLANRYAGAGSGFSEDRHSVQVRGLFLTRSHPRRCRVCFAPTHVRQEKFPSKAFTRWSSRPVETMMANVRHHPLCK